MQREEYIHHILEAIGGITREFNTRERYPFKQHALGHTHTDILFMLSQKECTIKELSEHLHVTSGAVTQFIDYLEEIGLVERTEHPHDKRSRLVRLTAGSEQEITMFREEYFRAIAGYFKALSDSELKTFFHILQKVEEQ